VTKINPKQIAAGERRPKVVTCSSFQRATIFFGGNCGLYGQRLNANFIVGAKVLCGLFVSPSHACRAPKAEPLS
jgi:hypothetical protein